LFQRYNYRAILVRFGINFLVLLFTVWIVPHIEFTGSRRFLSVLLIAAVFGLLNAFVKPLIQFLVLPLLFVSYGVVVVLINSFMLFLLSVIFPNRFEVDRLSWVVVGGLVVGLLGNVLEALSGLNTPILEEVPPRVAAEARRRELGPVGRLVDEAPGESGEETMPSPGAGEP
jgi:putative membrane protein